MCSLFLSRADTTIQMNNTFYIYSETSLSKFIRNMLFIGNTWRRKWQTTCTSRLLPCVFVAEPSIDTHPAVFSEIKFKRLNVFTLLLILLPFNRTIIAFLTLTFTSSPPSTFYRGRARNFSLCSATGNCELFAFLRSLPWRKETEYILSGWSKYVEKLAWRR